MTPANPDQYRIEDEGGHIKAIFRKDGFIVPIDAENQDYCTFLSWAGVQEKPAHPDLERLERGASYFADEAPLIKLLKDSGFVLYVDHTNYDPRPTFFARPRSGPSSVVSVLGHTRFDFLRLNQAIASTVPDDGGLTFWPLPFFVSPGLLRRLDESLNENRDCDIRRLSTLPVERTFVYIDISDYSKYPPGQQLLVVRMIQQITYQGPHWGAGEAWNALQRLEASICIGDGFVFVLPSAVDGLWFASRLANIIEAVNARPTGHVSIHFRCGVHVGSVYRFWDKDRTNWNYIGEGINGGNRVLTAIGKDVDDVVYISAAVREKVLAESPQSSALGSLHNRGRRADKHGQLWRVYEVNHTDLLQKHSAAIKLPDWL